MPLPGATSAFAVCLRSCTATVLILLSFSWSTEIIPVRIARDEGVALRRPPPRGRSPAVSACTAQQRAHPVELTWRGWKNAPAADPPRGMDLAPAVRLVIDPGA